MSARKAKAAALEAELIDAPYTVEDEIVQVDARSGYKVVHGYNDEGALFEIGRVRYRDYDDGGKVRALTLESALTGKEHPLGNASNTFRTHSHAQVLRPFLAAGFVPRKMVYNETGAQAISTLAHPGMVFEDLIGWDFGYLAEHGGLNVDGTTMELAVRVRSDLRSGYGVRADVGFFRLVCTNGLVSSVLNMGTFRANHANFSSAKINEFAGKMSASIHEMPTAPVELLDDVLEVLDRIDAEQGALSALPRLIREPAKMIAMESAGGKGEALRDNLRALRVSGKEQITKLDLINGQTNVAHAARSQWSVYNRTDQVVSALSEMVELAGVKRGVAAFE